MKLTKILMTGVMGLSMLTGCDGLNPLADRIDYSNCNIEDFYTFRNKYKEQEPIDCVIKGQASVDIDLSTHRCDIAVWHQMAELSDAEIFDELISAFDDDDNDDSENNFISSKVKFVANYRDGYAKGTVDILDYSGRGESSIFDYQFYRNANDIYSTSYIQYDFASEWVLDDYLDGGKAINIPQLVLETPDILDDLSSDECHFIVSDDYYSIEILDKDVILSAVGDLAREGFDHDGAHFGCVDRELYEVSEFDAENTKVIYKFDKKYLNLLSIDVEGLSFSDKYADNSDCTNHLDMHVECSNFGRVSDDDMSKPHVEYPALDID